MPTGIELILADHEVVNGLFAEFEKSGDATVVGQIVGALVAHDEAEHGALYPMSLELLGDAALIERFDAAHAHVKQLIEHLSDLEGSPLVDAVAALKAAVTDHVADEEADLLPAFEKAASPAELDELAARILHVKQRG